MQYRRGWSNRPRFLSRIKEYEEAFVGSDRLRCVGRMYGTSKNYTARHGEIGTDADRADGCSRRTDP